MQRDKHESRKSCVFSVFGSSAVLQVYSCVRFAFTAKNLVYLHFFLHLSLTVCMSLFLQHFFSFCCLTIVSKNMNEFRYLLKVFENGRLHSNRLEYFDKVKVLHLIFAWCSLLIDIGCSRIQNVLDSCLP